MGAHAVSCFGSSGTILRHNMVRDVVEKAFKEAGFEVRYEQKGGLTDKQRFGDVMVLNLRRAATCF